jgi:3-methyladenine DNA glycosylase/8-oxoguanine DNA glycosylase
VAVASLDAGLVRRFRLRGPLDLVLTLAPLRHGRPDLVTRLLGANGVLRATRTPEGPTTEHLRQIGDEVEVRAWGPGAGWAVEHAPALVGEGDDPCAFHPAHPFLAEIVRRYPGLRLCRSDAAYEAIVPAILEQKVTGLEAERVRRAMIRAFGEPAPGPPAVVTGLRLPPAPERLAHLAYYDLHPAGLERRRADVVIRLAGRAGAVERLGEIAPAEARTRLKRVAGIGPWTSAEVARVAWGDPDAISVGDYHLPNLVSLALIGDARGADDARMLELLAPYEGQRGRVQRLLEVAGIRGERRGPHMPARAIGRL